MYFIECVLKDGTLIENITIRILQVIWANAHEMRDSIGLELQSVQSSLKLQEIHKSRAILDFQDVLGRQ